MRLGKALATGVAEERPQGTDEGHRPDGGTAGDEVPATAAETAGPAPAAEEVPVAR